MPRWDVYVDGEFVGRVDERNEEIARARAFVEFNPSLDAFVSVFDPDAEGDDE